MLVEHSFDFGTPMTGLEIELNLVDDKWQPDMTNAEVLEAIADPDFQTELGRYNIEFNVAAAALSGDSMLDLETMLRASLDHAEIAGQRDRLGDHHDRHPADAADRALRDRLDERQPAVPGAWTRRCSPPAGRTWSWTSPGPITST